jgi:hypothetical protein
MSDYQAYRQNKTESGLVYQDFVTDFLARVIGLHVAVYGSKFYQYQKGESRTGVEIKNDQKFASTGNLYIEVAEKAAPRPGDYAQSGIWRGDNTKLFVIGDYEQIFIFPLHTLQSLCRSGRYRQVTTPTSVGFLLPAADAPLYAVWVFAPHAPEPLLQYNAELHDQGIRLARSLRHPGQTSFLDEVPS